MYVIASSMAGDELVQTRTVLNAILCFNGVNREIHRLFQGRLQSTGFSKIEKRDCNLDG